MSEERRSPEAFREQVVAQAMSLFASQGFDGTSVQQVADAVGASKQLVLYHFQSKDGLRLAVLESIRDLWKEFIPVLLDIAMRAEGNIEAVTDAFLAFIAQHPHTCRFVIRELISEGGEMRRVLYDLVQPSMRLTAGELARARGDQNASQALAQVQLMGILVVAVNAIYDRSEPNNADVSFELVQGELVKLLHRLMRG